jgi:hypothetical protein
VRGRIWLILGAAVGIAIALGRVPYLAGAGRDLADTSQRLVDSGAKHLIKDVASHGAPKRVILGLSGIVAVMLPGVTAVLLVVAAKASLRVRSIIALLTGLLGLASFFYEPHGKAIGVLVLALIVAGVTVALTGPLVAAPLAAAAALIGAEFLPSLMLVHRHVTQASVQAVHLAIFNKAGAPTWLQLVMLILAALPFGLAADLILRR